VRQLLLWEKEESKVDEFLVLVEKIQDFSGKISTAVSDAVYESKFGTDSIEDLDSLGKTIIGARVEHHIRNQLSALQGTTCDCLLNGLEFDIKTTVRKNWQISPKQVRNKSILLLLKINDINFSCGVIKVKEQFLNEGRNRDQKRTLSAYGKNNIDWIIGSFKYDRHK